MQLAASRQVWQIVRLQTRRCVAVSPVLRVHALTLRLSSYLLHPTAAMTFNVETSAITSNPAREDLDAPTTEGLVRRNQPCDRTGAPDGLRRPLDQEHPWL